MRHLYVGIDAAKDLHVACVIDSAGNPLLGLEFQPDREGLGKLLEKVSVLADKLGAALHFALEATGVYHLPVYVELVNRGYAVKVYNPLQLRGFRKKNLRKTKTDAVDALLIADMLRYEGTPAQRRLPEDILELREYCRARERLVRKLSDVKRQVQRNLSIIFRGYDTLFRDIFCHSSRALLREYTTPEAILALGEERLAALLKASSRGTLGKEKARRVLKACSAAMTPEHLAEPCVMEIRLLLEQLELLEEQLRAVEGEICRRFEEYEECELFTSVKGMRKVLAATIFANFGRLGDFAAPEKAVAFAGLDPSVVESGKFKAREHHISKRGSPHLRKALYQAANSCVRCNPVLRKVYLRKRKQGLSHRAAVCVAARKLVHILHAMSVNRKQFYVPEDIASS